MATTDARFGMIPYGPMKEDACQMFSIVTSCATAYFRGDVVEAGGASLLTPDMGNLLQCVVEADGAAGSLLGPVIALFDEEMTPVTSIAASEAGNSTIAGYALVCVDPYQRYIMQEDGDTESIEAAAIGLNAECIATHAGDTTTGRSGMEIDSSSKATTATLAVKLLGVHPEDTLSTDGAAGTHCRFIVMINSAHVAPNVAGV